jgi:predicted DsbA family dithiol-disulfide isomerase
MTQFQISIVSDTVCPWCFIGLRNLQAAIAERCRRTPRDTFTIKWIPFQLNPSAAQGQSIDKRASYEHKLGVDGSRQVFDRLRSAGELAGVAFSFDGKTGNTLDSHRLLELANRSASHGNSDTKDLQTRVAEQLFMGYFENSEDITSHEFLSRAAVHAGLATDASEIKEFLLSTRFANEIRKEADAQRADGINGVPLFIINDEYTIEGAQQPIAFSHLFERLAKKMRAAL